MLNSKEEKQKRIERYETLRISMKDKGFRETKCTISILKANLMALITTMPIILVCFILFYIKWKKIEFNITPLHMVIFLLSMFASIVVHEVIHGLTWSLFCKYKWKSIHLGVMWESLTPYCHCKETLKFGGYILGGLMPLIVLGIGLFILSLFIGNTFIFIISIINILSAGGDITIALMLLKYKKSLIFDHPTECGFIAFYK